MTTIVTMRKRGPLLALAGLAVLAALAFGAAKIGGQPQTAGVDRTNAMQVVKLEQPALAAGQDFFTEYRLERDKIRSERSDVLREIIKNAKNDDARQKAQDAVLKLVVEKQREAEMENLIKAKGFADALVLMRENSVSAIVRTQALSKDEVVQVADVISRVAGVRPEDITISAKQ